MSILLIPQFRTIDKPVEIAQEIALYLRARPHLTSLYIAAPLEEADLITAIKNELKDEFPIFTGESLLQFMLDSYPDCYWMKVRFTRSILFLQSILGELPRHIQQFRARSLRSVRYLSLRRR